MLTLSENFGFPKLVCNSSVPQKWSESCLLMPVWPSEIFPIAISFLFAHLFLKTAKRITFGYLTVPVFAFIHIFSQEIFTDDFAHPCLAWWGVLGPPPPGGTEVEFNLADLGPAKFFFFTWP